MHSPARERPLCPFQPGSWCRFNYATHYSAVIITHLLHLMSETPCFCIYPIQLYPFLTLLTYWPVFQFVIHAVLGEPMNLVLTSDPVLLWWCIQYCLLQGSMQSLNRGKLRACSSDHRFLSPWSFSMVRAEPALSLWKEHVAIRWIVISKIINRMQKVDWQTPIAWTGGVRDGGQGECLIGCKWEF